MNTINTRHKPQTRVTENTMNITQYKTQEQHSVNTTVHKQPHCVQKLNTNL